MAPISSTKLEVFKNPSPASDDTPAVSPGRTLFYWADAIFPPVHGIPVIRVEGTVMRQTPSGNRMNFGFISFNFRAISLRMPFLRPIKVSSGNRDTKSRASFPFCGKVSTSLAEVSVSCRQTGRPCFPTCRRPTEMSVRHRSSRPGPPV